MNLSEIERYLKHFPTNFNSRNSTNLKQKLKHLKKQLVDEGNQDAAKCIWCYERILEIQEQYILTFNKLKNKEYYAAWCFLEQIEIGISHLFKHLPEEENKFFISFIKTHAEQYQSLFPYKYFGSPELLCNKKICTICNKTFSIRNSCGHKVGEIYDGQMCHRIPSGIVLLAMAIVENPVQKFCVPFSTDPKTGERIDHYDYSLLEYLMTCLQSPFHAWSIKQTKRRHPHSKFKHIKPEDSCPCNSGNRYSDCCLFQTGVLLPHFQFILSDSPPDETKKLQYE